MNQTVSALDAALDAAAPSQSEWIAGRDAFYESQQNHPGDNEKAYRAALDAAAPDGDHWTAGENALVTNGGPALSEPEKRSFIPKKWKFKKGVHWSLQSAPSAIFRIILVAVGLLIFSMFQPLAFNGYHSTYGVGAGTAATIVLFFFCLVGSLIIGEAILRTLRNKHETTKSQES